MSSSRPMPLLPPPHPPDRPLFPFPLSNAHVLHSPACSTDQTRPELSCSNVNQLLAASLHKRADNHHPYPYSDLYKHQWKSRPSPPSLWDLYVYCRASRCPKRTLLVSSIATIVEYNSPILINAVHDVETCGMSSCPMTYSLALAKTCVPVRHPAVHYLWFKTHWNPIFISPELQTDFHNFKQHGSNKNDSTLGFCAISQPIGSPCSEEQSDQYNYTLGTFNHNAIRHLFNSVWSSSFYLFPSTLGDSVVVPKLGSLQNVQPNHLSYPANFYTPSICFNDRVVATNLTNSACSHSLHCRFGLCFSNDNTGHCITSYPSSAYNSTDQLRMDSKCINGSLILPIYNTSLNIDCSIGSSVNKDIPSNSANQLALVFALASIAMPLIVLLSVLGFHIYFRRRTGNQHEPTPPPPPSAVAARIFMHYPARRMNRESLPSYSPYPSQIVGHALPFLENSMVISDDHSSPPAPPHLVHSPTASSASIVDQGRASFNTSITYPMSFNSSHETATFSE